MHKSLITKFGRISPSVQPAILRYFYQDLTGDSSASSNLTEEEIDTRVCQVIDMEPEDSQTIIDLRSINSSSECFIGMMYFGNSVLNTLMNVWVQQLMTGGTQKLCTWHRQYQFVI